jgi:hypothetical protein
MSVPHLHGAGPVLCGVHTWSDMFLADNGRLASALCGGVHDVTPVQNHRRIQTKLVC